MLVFTEQSVCEPEQPSCLVDQTNSYLPLDSLIVERQADASHEFGETRV